MAKPAARELTSRRVAQDIAQEIYDRGLKPGDKYLPEADALKKHGVARGTLREALRYLEIQGVLRVRSGPGGGAVVDRPGWPHLASTIALLLQFAHAPFRTVLQARSVIEPGMAELAARNATDYEVNAMADDLDAIGKSIGVHRRYVETYARFWRRLAESTHNPLLAFLSPALRAIVDSAGFVPNELYRAETLERLRRVHAAVAARDAEGARLAMRALEDEFERRLTTGYPRQMERVVAWSDLMAQREP
ncbi:MAG: hypothetical protein BroJett013_28990 [Alphaproteobacteria bacterium]|nr:MAG: hypothetical protein BroJett013_28990 [Alphaproteobacteria bacterium]